jgi:hypothetical protein
MGMTMADDKDDIKGEMTSIVSDVDASLCHEMASILYKEFNDRQVSTVDALGVMAFLVAYLMKDRIRGADDEMFKSNVASFAVATVQMYQQIELNDDKGKGSTH